MPVKEHLFKISACGISDVGLVRQNNEDVWAECPEDSFYAIADGMGGHQAGEVAANAAVNGLCAIIKDVLEHRLKGNCDPEALGRALKLAIQEVNRAIYRMGQQDKLLHGMGTTLSCLLLSSSNIIFGHVGDSRIYRLRNHRLIQLTQDHSLLRELIEMGQLSETQVRTFAHKNILTKAIGTEPTVEPTIHHESLHKQDLYLLCTDGLTDHLSTQEIESILVKQPLIQQAAKVLVETAKTRGGSDNITLVLIQVT